MTPPIIKLHKNNDESIVEERQLIDLNKKLKQVKLVRHDVFACYIITFCLALLLLTCWFFSWKDHRIRHCATLNNHIENQDDFCTNIPQQSRFDCHPEDGASELSCHSRGCCWAPISKKFSNNGRVPLNVPYCFYPSNWQIYKLKNKTSNGLINTIAYYESVGSSFYKNDLKIIRLDEMAIDKNILRVKVYDPTNRRYEPPWPIRKNHVFSSRNISSLNYKVEMHESKPGFRVRRLSKNAPTLFDSIEAGGFIFANQFLQMSSMIKSHNIYGLGEHRSSLKLNTKWQSFTFFNKDQPPTEFANLYGSHPFFIVMEESGDCHGVLFINSNAMEIILQPAPALTFRSIGGIFDIYFFMGPTPADVLKQYSNIVGKPFMPPYWSLGFHLCRFGYKSLEETMRVWSATRSAGIPFDTQWNDLDYMNNNNDFTYNNKTFKGLPDFVNQLHNEGMHYIPLIDPGISASETKGSYAPFDEGLRYDIFIKDPDTTKPFTGKVWNRVSTVWPDFTHPSAAEYWYKMMNDMHQQFPYDGAWIDMNEPSNFYNGKPHGCSSNSFDNPPYVPNVVGNYLATKTLCMNAKHYLGPHYNIHNIYGMAEAVATNSALTKIRNKRPFIVSRATWLGHGHYAAHWTGDIYSSWYDLRMSVPEILSFSFFQIPMVGADICGFDGNTTVLLCNRWMQLGAFYPFSRNHNSDDTIAQDPVSMGPIVVESSKRVLGIRYRFLPYLYTLFYRAHRFGETVARPLFVEFPEDRTTWDLDTQFLWGSAFMIVPVLEENADSVKFYLPQGIWYGLEFPTNKSIKSSGQHFTLPVVDTTIPILIRGGFILPAKDQAMNTVESQKKNFQLLIAPNFKGQASGELYWDDGDSLDSIEKRDYRWIQFKYENQKLSSDEIERGFYNGEMNLGRVEIFGVEKKPTRVIVNDKNVQFKYTPDLVLTVGPLQINLKKKFILSWM